MTTKKFSGGVRVCRAGEHIGRNEEASLPKAKKPLPEQEQVEAPQEAPQDFYTRQEINPSYS
jgi:hypothetical protein